MACHDFDEQVVRRDPKLAALLEQFVCVRLIQANTLDLELFQFDYDLTFAGFFFNADRMLYGRYGTRSDSKEASRDISLEGLGQALARALEWHRGYPGNKRLFAGKQGKSTVFKTPGDYPSLRGKYQPTLDYAGQVVRSCLHCHQVRDAEIKWFRDQGQPLPSATLFPWPRPETIGLTLDPRECATVKSVAKGSVAAQAGFKTGDALLVLGGQPILSVADVQWVLHHVSGSDPLPVTVRRGKRERSLTLRQNSDWRDASDLSWRTSTWDLRRMVLGGLYLVDPSPDERKQAGLAAGTLALRAEHVGEYGEHAAAKRAGVRKNDLIVGVDGDRRPRSESQLLADLLQNRQPGGPRSLRDSARRQAVERGMARPSMRKAQDFKLSENSRDKSLQKSVSFAALKVIDFRRT